ncbi:hypothetical protein V6N13_053830 [Hibiscus sabdariffa]|uniref:EF-hand domain-containing protein n=1 Tax=Hibiscus sabdariffa TaxID=183260 RepID=A0ABR2T6T6_9ROSI
MEASLNAIANAASTPSVCDATRITMASPTTPLFLCISPWTKPDLTEAFKVFDEDEDEDGDGFISAQELQAEGKEIGRVEQMICSVDQNHDGRVDFFDFKHMMQSVAGLVMNVVA